jgi:squalene cyclase
MPNDRTGDIQINVPVTTDFEVVKDIEQFVFTVQNNEDQFLGFQEAVTNAGINTAPKKNPPYLLIGGALILSYFLFFK